MVGPQCFNLLYRHFFLYFFLLEKNNEKRCWLIFVIRYKVVADSFTDAGTLRQILRHFTDFYFFGSGTERQFVRLVIPVVQRDPDAILCLIYGKEYCPVCLVGWRADIICVEGESFFIQRGSDEC